MKTTKKQTPRVEATMRGSVGVGNFRRTLNSILTEVANGSRRIPLSVYEGAGTMVYHIHHEGVYFTLQIAQKGGEV